MPPSARDLLRAKEAAEALLDELGIDAYLFEVEPRNGPWLLKVDCAIEDGWQSTAVPFDKDDLLASRRKAGIRTSLLDSWRSKLAACKVTSKDE